MKEKDKLATYQAKQRVVQQRAETKRKDNRLSLVAGAAALAVALGGQLAYFGFGPGAQSEVAQVAQEETEAPQPEVTPVSDPLTPDPSIAEDRVWSGALSLNSQPISFELYGDKAPQATANFVSLVQDGYFEGISCHRLTTAGIFVLQCGDPNGDGTGGPGYSWGPIENAPADDLYPAGTIAMARRGGDDFSMGSQFFIVYQDSQIPSDFVGGYTVFGTLTDGLAVVEAIAEAGVAGGGTDGSPVEAVTITDVSVE
jgi:peptidyl-prolyl cis-trans isomerase B (cyclophilin B)